MFEYLCRRVRPSKDSIKVMFDRELPELVSRIQGDSLNDDLARLCREIDRGSVLLGRAIRAGGVAFVDSYKDRYPNVPEELWSIFQLRSVTSILVALRLVERELEADDLAQRLGMADESKE